MTWIYDDALGTARDRVRLLVGDIDSADPLISDEAIALYLPGGSLGQASEAAAYRTRAAELRATPTNVTAPLIGSLALVGTRDPGGQPIFTRTLGDYP
jgi:hypothetical protein